MKIQVKFKLGRAEYTLFIDEGKNMDSLHVAAVLGNPPHRCNSCDQHEVFKLESNKDKESNIYINVLCKKCGAKAKLGQYKSGGYFWHKFVKYEKAGASENIPEKDINQDVSDEFGGEEIEPF